MRFTALLIFLFSLACAPSAAQDKDCRKITPRFLTKDPKKLAKYLTHNLVTDEEKICYIYTWMTHHIKYDVKKWLHFDYQRVPVKKILRRRKAICTGYSDLFNELCKHAGVRSVDVPGYTKNMDVDIIDTFYLDDHVWNAAYVDNGWMLFDVTWDAGYVKYFKRTVWGFFVHVFTLGRRDHLKYKPHFKQAPQRNYYNRSGNVFSIDHHPVMPEWQLTDTLFTLNKYKQDSSFYFKEYGRPDAGTFKQQETEVKREEYFHQTETEREIAMGFTGYSLNGRNHFGIGKSYVLLGAKENEKIDPLSTDTAQQKKIANAVLAHWHKVAPHLDSNANLIYKQRNELVASNRFKKEILTSHNKKLIASSFKVLNQGKQGIQSAGKNRVTCKGHININNRKYGRAKQDHSFARIRSPLSTREKDSTLITQALGQIDDSISRQRDQLMTQYADLDSGYFRTLKALSNHLSESGVVRAMEGRVISTRLWYFDDLDYEVRRLKDTVMFRKFLNDSSLLENKFFIVKKLFDDLGKLKTGMNRQYVLLKTRANLAEQLKKVCADDSIPKKEYRSTLQSMQNEFNSYNNELQKWVNRSLDIKRLCRKLKKTSRREIRAYTSEKYLEYNLFLVRNRYIKRHARSLLRTNTALKKMILKPMKKVDIYRTKLAKAKKK